MLCYTSSLPSLSVLLEMQWRGLFHISAKNVKAELAEAINSLSHPLRSCQGSIGLCHPQVRVHAKDMAWI